MPMREFLSVVVIASLALLSEHLSLLISYILSW